MKNTMTRAALALALSLAPSGCSGDTNAPVESTESGDAAVSMQVLNGDAELLVGDTWLPAPRGTRHEALAVRAGSAVAEIAIGDPDSPGLLWLQMGSEVSLAVDATGTWQIAMARGEARLSLPSRQRAVFAERALTGDHLLTPGFAERTARATQRADWSVGAEETPAERTGIGSLRVEDLDDGVAGDLALTSVSVDARVEGAMAYTSVEHVFRNNTGRVLEGTFDFPMPERTTVMGLAMNIGPEMMEGALIERQWAKEIFQGYVDRWKNRRILQDPALLEWDGGTMFKLRIFPIEAHGYKRVVLRYLSPLTKTNEGWQYEYPTAAPESEHTIGRFRVRFNGETVTDESDFTPGPTTVVHVPLDQIADNHREVTEDAVFTSVRLQPSWPNVEAACSTLGRNVAFVFDTSRSSLERHLLAVSTLRALIDQLEPGDRVAILSADVVVRDHTGGFVALGDAALEKALDAIARIAPEGASDLHTALEETGELLSTVENGDVIYLGDGHATWGERDESTLVKSAAKALNGARLFALTLQDDTDHQLLQTIAGESRGFVSSPRSPAEVRAFAMRWRLAPCSERMTDVTVTAGPDDEVVIDGDDTVFEGEELEAIVESPAGKSPPESVTLSGWLGGRKVTETLPLSATQPAAYISHRWGAQRIEEMQRGDDVDPQTVVKTSLAHHVMSRYTAFLVLETLADYRRYGIEPPALPSEVSDGHFYGTPGQLTPAQFRPGDPEVRIAAPETAQSVLVVFPFGEQKYATFEREARVWVTRFLIDDETPDGAYTIRVRITHADGRVELTTLPYVVDTTPPELEVRLSRSGDGHVIEARQIVTAAETRALAALRGQKAIGVAGKGEGDLKHVDVRLPDGTVVALQPSPGYPGRFHAGVNAALSGAVNLRVVGHDVANNAAVAHVMLDARERVWVKAKNESSATATEKHASSQSIVEERHGAYNDVHACLPREGGMTLAATMGGALVVDGLGRTTTIGSAPSRALLEAFGAVWIASDDGVVVLQASTLTKRETLSWMKRARALAQHEAKLYVGTWDGGLWAYDPATGKDERIPFASGSKANAERWRITALAAHGGALWVGTAGDGAYVLKSGALHPTRHRGYITSLASQAGTLSVGTLEGVTAGREHVTTMLATALTESGMVVTAEDGLFHRSGSTLSPLGLAGSRLRGALLTAARSCAASDRGLWVQRTGGGWQRHDLGGPASQDIAAIAHDGERLYAGTFDQGLHVFDDGRWARAFAEQIDDKVNVLLRAHGRLYVGTARGLHVVSPDGARRFVGKLPSRDIHSLAATRDGLLVGTARGAVIIRGETVHNVEPNHVEGRARGIWATAVTGEGRPLLGTSRGLYYPNEAGEWTRLSLASGHLPEDWVTALAVSGDDVYVGTYNHGVVRLRLDDPSPGEALGGGWVNFNGLHVHDGELFAATMGGLLVRPLHAGRWRRATEGDTTGVLPVSAGMWVAGRRGLTLVPGGCDRGLNGGRPRSTRHPSGQVSWVWACGTVCDMQAAP